MILKNGTNISENSLLSNNIVWYRETVPYRKSLLMWQTSLSSYVKNFHRHTSFQQPPPWLVNLKGRPFTWKKITTSWRWWWLAFFFFFCNNSFKWRYVGYIFRHNAITQKKITAKITFLCTGKPKIYVTVYCNLHFIVVIWKLNPKRLQGVSVHQIDKFSLRPWLFRPLECALHSFLFNRLHFSIF